MTPSMRTVGAGRSAACRVVGASRRAIEDRLGSRTSSCSRDNRRPQPAPFDLEVARESLFGGLIVQGGVTSGILNAVVAEDLPGPGSVFLGVEWQFVKAVYVGDTITGRVEVTHVREDKPICKLTTTVRNQNGETCLSGTATTYTAPLRMALSWPCPPLERVRRGRATLGDAGGARPGARPVDDDVVLGDGGHPPAEGRNGHCPTRSFGLADHRRTGWALGRWCEVGMSTIPRSPTRPRPRVLIVLGPSRRGGRRHAGILLTAGLDVVLWAAVGHGHLPGSCVSACPETGGHLVRSGAGPGAGGPGGRAHGVGCAAPHLINALGGLRWQVVIASATLATLCWRRAWSLRRSLEGPVSISPSALRARADRAGSSAIAAWSWPVLGYFGHMWELYAMWAWFLDFARQGLALNSTSLMPRRRRC